MQQTYYVLIFLMQFEGAFRMIADLEDMNFKPTTNMYNAIMAGYFREVTFLNF